MMENAMENHELLSGGLTTEEIQRLKIGLETAARVREYMSQCRIMRVSHANTLLMHPSATKRPTATMAKAVEFTLKLADTIDSIECLRRQHANIIEKQKTIQRQIETLLAQSPTHRILPGIPGNTAVDFLKLNDWMFYEAQQIVQANKDRKRVGMPALQLLPDPSTYAIHKLHHLLDSCNAAIAELRNASQALQLSQHPILSIRRVQESLSQYKSMAETELSKFPLVLISRSRQFETEKREAKHQLKAHQDLISHKVRFTAAEINDVLSKCDNEIQIRTRASDSDFQKFSIQKMAPEMELLALRAAAIKKYSLEHDMSQDAPHQPPSRFVLITYDSRHGLLAAEMIPSSWRVWSTHYAFLKCSYIEFKLPMQYTDIMSFANCAGIDIRGIHGCHAIAMGPASIQMHPAMRTIVADCCRMGAFFIFTGVENMTMMEPPFALELSARRKLFNAQVTMAEFASAAQEFVSGASKDTSEHEDTHEQDNIAQLMHALHTVRGVQIILYTRMYDKNQTAERLLADTTKYLERVKQASVAR
jgi:hypothetical protein